ncbi:hypothetical protein Hte_005571 [Hypoxylon texense]
MSRFTSSTAGSTSIVPTSITSLDRYDEDPTFKFTNIHDLFRIIDSISGDSLIFTEISPSNFARVDHERSKRRRKFRWRLYHAESQTLIVAITTRVHEVLHLTIYLQYHARLCRAGTETTWATIGATTFPSGGDFGEGDSTGAPSPQRDRKGSWPTLVVLGGCSLSLNQLRNVMRWWFSASSHDVKIVILAKFDRGQSKIILEKWEEAAATRPEATTTRRAAAVQQMTPVLRQEITIRRDEAMNPASYNVTRGPLVLEFKLLYLRDPGPQETDFIIDIPDLQRYAEAVWRHV